MGFFKSYKNNNEAVIDTSSTSRSNSYSIAKVFGWMFLWLAITSVVALGLGYAMNVVMNNLLNGVAGSEDVMIGFLVAMVISAIAVLVLTIVIQIVFLRKGRSILVPAIIYSILMGVLCSTFTFMLPWWLLGISFAITCALFGIMSLIALLAKQKLNGLAIAGMGLFFGALMMSGFMLIVMLLFPQYYEWYYWIISLALLCGVVLTTIYDISRIKTLAAQGALTKNLSMYLGFTLYCDFMYILIRIIEIIARFTGNSSSN